MNWPYLLAFVAVVGALNLAMIRARERAARYRALLTAYGIDPDSEIPEGKMAGAVEAASAEVGYSKSAIRTILTDR